MQKIEAIFKKNKSFIITLFIIFIYLCVMAVMNSINTERNISKIKEEILSLRNKERIDFLTNKHEGFACYRSFGNQNIEIFLFYKLLDGDYGLIEVGVYTNQSDKTSPHLYYGRDFFSNTVIIYDNQTSSFYQVSPSDHVVLTRITHVELASYIFKGRWRLPKYKIQ